MSSSSGTSERASWYPSSDSFSSRQLHDTLLYTCAARPLVYYAQVEPRGGQGRGRSAAKKDNPNCFVKAFHWYTQEHDVDISADFDTEMDDEKDYSGFASWLDQKYNQFLQDNRLKNSLPCSQSMGQSSILRTRTKKTYYPWKKRRRASVNQDGGDRSEKCNQNFETILHPKMLGHPVSERCLPIKAETCDSAKVTATSSDTQINTKVSGQRCLGSEIEQKETHVITIEATVAETEIKQSKTHIELKNSRFSPGPHESVDRKRLESQRKATKDVSCACPVPLVNEIETGGQSKKMDMKTESPMPSPLPISPVIKTNWEKIEKKSVECECRSERESIERSTQYNETDPMLPSGEAGSVAASRPGSAGDDRGQSAIRSTLQAQNYTKRTKGIICECRFIERNIVEWQCPGRRSAEAGAQTSDVALAPNSERPLLLRIVGARAGRQGNNNNTHGL